MQILILRMKCLIIKITYNYSSPIAGIDKPNGANISSQIIGVDTASGQKHIQANGIC